MGELMQLMVDKTRLEETSEGRGWRMSPLDREVADALEPAWRDLLHNAVENNINFAPWFVIPSMPLLEAMAPKIVTFYSDGKLIGLLIVREDFGYAKIPLKFYKTALQPHQFLGTPLVRKGYTEQFADRLLDWLAGARRSINFFLLPLMSGENDVVSAIKSACAQSGNGFAELDRRTRAAMLPTGGKPEHFDRHLSANRRKSLRRQWRNLSSQGEPVFERLNNKRDVPSWLEGFFTLENMGWKKEQSGAIQENPRDVAYYREMAPAAFDDGALNFFRLTLSGKPIAYTMDFVSGSFAYTMRCAHDLAFRRFSPGVLMEYESLKFYRQNMPDVFVDSCAHADNQMLNSMWPDRKAIVTIAIGRRETLHNLQFKAMTMMKNQMNRRLHAAESIGGVR